MSAAPHAMLEAFLTLLALAALQKAPEAPPPPPDVLLWITSGLRADRVLAAEGPTPTARALAARGLVFEHCFATAPEPVAAAASLFSATHPAVHGLWSARAEDPRAEPPRLSADLPSLAEAFRSQGYQTVCIADGGFLLESRGFERGFEHFDSRYRLARERAELALEFLEGRRDARPYLLVVQTNQARPPWFADPKLLERRADPAYDGPLRDAARRAWGKGGPRLEGSVRNAMGALFRQHYEALLAKPLEAADLRFAGVLYDLCVQGTDHQLGRVLAYLEKLGRRPRTLVVLASDHGLSLGEEAPLAAEALVEGVLRVPLVIAGPGVEPGRFAGTACTVDLAPTLLALCGLEAQPGMQGRALLRAGPAQHAFAETRAGGARLLVRGAEGVLVVDPESLAAGEGGAPSAPPETLTAAARAFLASCAALRAELGR